MAILEYQKCLRRIRGRRGIWPDSSGLGWRIWLRIRARSTWGWRGRRRGAWTATIEDSGTAIVLVAVLIAILAAGLVVGRVISRIVVSVVGHDVPAANVPVMRAVVRICRRIRVARRPTGKTAGGNIRSVPSRPKRGDAGRRAIDLTPAETGRSHGDWGTIDLGNRN